MYKIAMVLCSTFNVGRCERTERHIFTRAVGHKGVLELEKKYDSLLYPSELQKHKGKGNTTAPKNSPSFFLRLISSNVPPVDATYIR